MNREDMAPIRLSVSEALELSERRKNQWVLLSLDGNGRPTYACPACWRERVKLVTPGAKIPTECPGCLTKLTHVE